MMATKTYRITKNAVESAVSTVARLEVAGLQGYLANLLWEAASGKVNLDRDGFETAGHKFARSELLVLAMIAYGAVQDNGGVVGRLPKSGAAGDLDAAVAWFKFRLFQWSEGAGTLPIVTADFD